MSRPFLNPEQKQKKHSYTCSNDLYSQIRNAAKLKKVTISGYIMDATRKAISNLKGRK